MFNRAEIIHAVSRARCRDELVTAVKSKIRETENSQSHSSPSPSHTKRFSRIAKLGKIKELIDQDIKITMKGGKVHKGVLRNADKKSLSLDKEIHGGTFSFNISLSNIKSIEY